MSSERGEVLIITRPIGMSTPSILDGLRGAASGALEMLGAAVSRVAGPPTQAVLDLVVPPVADAVVSRVDINEIVLRQVDLRRVVLAALDSIDITAIVLDRVDLRAIVYRALDELNLTEVVTERVDVDEIARTIDLDEIIDRVPIVTIAEYVIEEIDLPRIIRESTGGVATDAMDSVRLQTYGVDQAVARIVDKVLPRNKRDVDAPGDPQSLECDGPEEPQ